MASAMLEPRVNRWDSPKPLITRGETSALISIIHTFYQFKIGPLSSSFTLLSPDDFHELVVPIQMDPSVNKVLLSFLTWRH